MTSNRETTEKKGFGEVVRDSLTELKETLLAFVKAPKALWGVNIPYVLEGLVYFGILTILGKYCSENVQLSDLHSGWVYGFVTGGITFAMLLLGGVTDKLGVRNSLALSLGAMMAGRILISLSGTLPLGAGIGSPMFWLMSAGLLIMVAAYGLFQPAAYAGVKRYTNPQTAAMGYAVIYGLMNLGAFFSGFISSGTRHAFENVFPPNGLTAVFWVYSGLTFLAALVVVVILTKKTDQAAVARIARETAEMEEEKGGKSEDKTEQTETKKIDNRLLWAITTVTMIFVFWLFRNVFVLEQTWGENWGLLTVSIAGIIGLTFEFLRHRPDHPFRDLRFVFFIFALIPVQTLFAHNWLTIPYYLDRAFAGTFIGEYFEVFSNLNPILIFFLAPIIAGLTSRANVYRMMILGTLVMSLPTFLLAVGPNSILFLTYIVLMTIGEAMWQPRFLQWIAEIAPEGKTGAYMGIGQFPWFLTKLLTATYSGWFVANYIPKPETGLPMRTGEMWFYYGLIAVVSSVLLIIAKNWMMKGMKEMKEKAA
ncbi:MAG: hypothetical protein Kow0037_24740 [Calditrichia bacterium]